MDEMRREFRPRDRAAEAIAAIDAGLAEYRADAERLQKDSAALEERHLAEERQYRQERAAAAVDRLLGPVTEETWRGWNYAAQGDEVNGGESRPDPNVVQPRRRPRPQPRSEEHAYSSPWERDDRALLLVQLAGERGTTPTELAAAMHVSKGQAYHSLDRLLHERRRVRKQGRGRYVAVQREEVNR